MFRHKHRPGRAAALCTCAAMLCGHAQPQAASGADESQLDAILAEIVTDEMTGYDKLCAITKYTAEHFDYSAAYQRWYEMLEYGSGDCWASTEMIHLLCDKAGIKNIRHDSSFFAFSGSGHINLVALIDGEYYLADAGESGEKPRHFRVDDLGASPVTVSVKDGTATLTRYYGFETAYEIPEEAEGAPVTKIAPYAFSDRQLTEYSRNNSKLCYQFWHWDFSRVESVRIPETVTAIDTRAFMCSKLQAVEIPASVTQLPEYTFYFSEDLKTVTLPASLTSIGENAFGECAALEKVYYAGTRAQWEALSIAEGNECLLAAEFRTADDVLPGDTDGDGVRTAADAVLLQSYLLGHKVTLSAKAADLNTDSRLDARDLTSVKRIP